MSAYFEENLLGLPNSAQHLSCWLALRLFYSISLFKFKQSRVHQGFHHPWICMEGCLWKTFVLWFLVLSFAFICLIHVSLWLTPYWASCQTLMLEYRAVSRLSCLLMHVQLSSSPSWQIAGLLQYVSCISFTVGIFLPSFYSFFRNVRCLSCCAVVVLAALCYAPLRISLSLSA